MIIPEETHGFAQFGGQPLGQGYRFIFGQSLAQIDEDLGNGRALIVQINTGDNIGLVFLPCERGSLLVRGPLRQGVDRPTPNPAVGDGIRMQRNKQISLGALGDGDAFAQPYEDIPIAR